MKCGAALIVCLLLVSCATMKNGSTRPTEEIGLCGGASYDSAKIGEKEILAGKYLFPGGIILSFVGVGLLGGGLFGGDNAAIASGATMVTIGPLSFIAGIITFIDGQVRVSEWNKNCTGATAAERYCLFEPLLTSRGETP